MLTVYSKAYSNSFFKNNFKKLYGLSAFTEDARNVIFLSGLLRCARNDFRTNATTKKDEDSLGCGLLRHFVPRNDGGKAPRNDGNDVIARELQATAAIYTTKTTKREGSLQGKLRAAVALFVFLA